MEKSAHDIWFALFQCYSTVYVGYPNKIRSDLEAVVESDQFRDLAETNWIELQLLLVEAHNAIGVGE